MRHGVDGRKFGRNTSHRKAMFKNIANAVITQEQIETTVEKAKELGLQDKLFLGNLDAKRDWGHAKDYVEAMYLILQQDVAEDYVIATGTTIAVRDFVRMAFEEIGVTLRFEGEGINEKGFIAKADNPLYPLEVGRQVVGIHPRYFRPAEVDLLIGDATKANTKLGWIPKYDLKSMIKEMMAAELIYQAKE